MTDNAERQLTKLFLMMHALPRDPELRAVYMAKWAGLFAAEGPDEGAVLIVFFAGTAPPDGRAELTALAHEKFPGRVLIWPQDTSIETKAMIADDLDRTLNERGRFDEWLPIEIWSSNRARRWAEGTKRELAKLGYAYDPATLRMVSFGRAWGGCATKYSSFMARYLDLQLTPDARADLCPSAGLPLAAEFRERLALDRHVYLWLFELADGRPMAQFTDGRRAVWEPPHVARVSLDPEKVAVYAPGGEYLRAPDVTRVEANAIIADVCDGCRPGITSLIADDIPYEEFKQALAAAEISPRSERRRVLFRAGGADPQRLRPPPG